MAIKTDQSGMPILDQFSEEGFFDCVFRIVELTEQDGTVTLILRATSNGTSVGFGAMVRRDIRAGLDADSNLVKDHVYRRGVFFFRTGPESDRLMTAFARAYGDETPSKVMIEKEEFTVIALAQGDLDILSEPARMKIFGNDGPADSEDDYYESFFNLDIPGGYAYWNEKDPEYRGPLLRSMTSSRPNKPLEPTR